MLPICLCFLGDTFQKYTWDLPELVNFPEAFRKSSNTFLNLQEIIVDPPPIKSVSSAK